MLNKTYPITVVTQNCLKSKETTSHSEDWIVQIVLYFFKFYFMLRPNLAKDICVRVAEINLNQVINTKYMKIKTYVKCILSLTL